ncbi:hypothetical protein C8J48_1230 [Desmospora activa DSM 45169]|uniref:Uncharacterized protein n=1 Tax=Desmospora activa DSM 45169 TaxID=1121389 RepID=A0A2T4Z9U9_9BACL|nr:hypothetical protein C8J48_1230 [Desmospora activa DSM 45169]
MGSLREPVVAANRCPQWVEHSRVVRLNPSRPDRRSVISGFPRANPQRPAAVKPGQMRVATRPFVPHFPTGGVRSKGFLYRAKGGEKP